MNFKIGTLAAAVAATFVGGLAAVDAASAGTVAAGTYNMVILTTPVTTAATVSGTVSGYNFGTNGNWQSSFTLGGGLPGVASQAMTDNATIVNCRCSGIGGDGWAGIIGVTIDGSGNMTFNTGGIGPMTGSINLSTGAATFTPSGRQGTFGDFPSLVDERWNVDDANLCTTTGCANDGNTNYNSFTTGSAAPLTGGTANGKVFTAIADQNADGISDYLGVLVSGGNVGSDWADFFGTEYLEVWRVRLLSTATSGLHIGFNVDTIYGTGGGNFAQYFGILDPPPCVPVPAAVWLFGSGLLGLVGVARHTKTAWRRVG